MTNILNQYIDVDLAKIKPIKALGNVVEMDRNNIDPKELLRHAENLEYKFGFSNISLVLEGYYYAMVDGDRITDNCFISLYWPTIRRIEEMLNSNLSDIYDELKAFEFLDKYNFLRFYNYDNEIVYSSFKDLKDHYLSIKKPIYLELAEIYKVNSERFAKKSTDRYESLELSATLKSIPDIKQISYYIQTIYDYLVASELVKSNELHAFKDDDFLLALFLEAKDLLADNTTPGLLVDYYKFLKTKRLLPDLGYLINKFEDTKYIKRLYNKPVYFYLEDETIELAKQMINRIYTN